MRKKHVVKKGAVILFTAAAMMTVVTIPAAGADEAAAGDAASGSGMNSDMNSSMNSSASSEDTEQRDFSAGISVLSPGLPAALKGVWMPGDWGLQAEWNYFYALGMLRLDGRRTVRQSGPFDLYGFAGITGNHFNDGKHTADSVNNTLMADFGAGGEVFFGRKQHFSLGAEFGLLIPFWSSQGLEKYEDSGLMVANFSILYWF